MTKKIKPRDKPHYVNNREFSQKVVDYVETVRQAEAEGKSLPVVTNYIANCFLKIAEGLSHKSNFIRYTYREEMVMDAVENCLKAITNYNIEAATRTGNPNAFAYFTQICYYAFLRRIAKEKKQQDIKFKWIEKASIDEFLQSGFDGDPDQGRYFVAQLRSRIDKVKDTDKQIKDFATGEKLREKKAKGVELFMGDE